MAGTVASLGFSIISRYSGHGVAQARRDLLALRAQLATINGDLNRHTQFLERIPSRWKAIGVAIAAVGPALVPLTAQLLSTAAALTTLGVAAGGAAGIWGAALKGALGRINDTSLGVMALGKNLAKQKAILDNMTPGTAHYEKQLKAVAKAQDQYNHALADADPSQRAFLTSMQKMNTAWQQFISDTQSQTLGVAGKVVEALAVAIGKLEPVVRAVTPLANQVADAFRHWVDIRMDGWMKFLIDHGIPALTNMVTIGKNLGSVFGTMLRTFAGEADKLGNALARGSSELKAWADGGGFKRFLEYVQQNGPKVRAFWDAFMDALRNVLRILKEFSAGSLNVLTDALKGIASIDPGAVMAFANSLLLLKSPLLWLVLNCPPLRDMIVTLLGGMNAQIVYALAGAFVALRVAFLFMNTALLTTPLGWLIVGITALIVAIVAIATKTTWFQTAWKYTWNFIKTVAETIWNGLKAAWSAVVNALITAWNAVSGALTTAWNAVWGAIRTAATTVWGWLQTAWGAVVGFFTTIWNTISGPLIAAWNLVWNGIKTAATMVWDLLKVAWNAFITAIQTIWAAVSAPLGAAWSVFWNVIKTAAELVWNGLKMAWQLLVSAFQTIWTAVSTVLSAAWNAFWTVIKTAAELVWNALKAAWQLLWTAMTTAWNTFKTLIQAAWTVFWTALKTAADLVWNALKMAWQLLWTAMTTAWNTFKAIILAAWNVFWTGLQTAANTVWEAIKGLWNTFWENIKTVWNTFKDFFTGAWQGFWDGVKDVASKVWDGIKGVVEAGVNGCIDIINGIIGAWNTITSAVGLDSLNIDKIGHVSLAIGGVVGDMPHFALGGTINFSSGGGVLGGFAPGRDTVPAMLSRGEGVLTPEAVRGLGGPGFVNSANRKFAGHRGAGRGAAPLGSFGFAQGGMTAAVTLGSAQAWHRSGGATGWSFALGGLPSEIPIPDPDGPKGPSTGGGTVGQKPEQAKESKGLFEASGLGTITDAFGNAMDFGTMVLGFIGEQAIRAAFGVVSGLIDAFGGFGPFGDMLKGMMNKLKEALIDNLIKRDQDAKSEYEAMAVAGAQSVQAWAPLAAKALQMAGLAPSQLQAFLALMSAESGGNPNAINLYDINAKNGVPSQGLMQVIPPTFAAYHVAGTSNNILDPLANMAASANYIKNRYGGTVPGSPYALGTPGATSGLHLVGEQGPELVNFAGGETVTPADETSSILAGQGAMASAMGAVGAAAMSGMGSTGASAPSGGSGGSAASVSTPAGVMELIQTLLSSAKELQATLTSMWATVVSTTNSSWSAIYGQSFTPMNANLTGTVPASVTAMQTAWTTGMGAMTTSATAQWTAMNTSAFTPMNDMMTTTVPAAATAMSTNVTGATQELQSGVQESWDATLASTQTTWTGVATSITDSVNAATTPINGLLGGFNNVSSALGMGISVPLIAFETGGMVPAFATGGMFAHNGGTVPGYSPGRDTFPAMLSPGEGVLTPEAVRGLGGPGFVYAANRKWSGHRGGGGSTSAKIGKFMGGTGVCDHYATGGMAGIRDANGVQHFMSGSITAQDAEGLAEAGVSGSLVTQGSFSTGVAASAGTHDGDGVLDFGSTSLEGQLRNGGWAAWTRGNGDGMSPHTHAVYLRASGASPGAKWQMLDYINGGSGLGVSSASDAELAQWGLGLGRWDFGPLLTSIINGAITSVPQLLKPLVLRKLTAEQVTSGFAPLKAALDATDMGTGMFADGLRGVGNKTHDGIVSSITSQVGAASFDEGGLLQPGYTLAFNGTGKPEPVGHNLEPRGSHGKVEINMPITINGNADAQAVIDGINSQVLPQLRQMLVKGTGTNG